MSHITVTRLAHSMALIDFNGQIILTDPWFSEKPGYHPGEPLGMTLEALPRLAGVIVSHDHYDHYDMEAFQAYPDKSVPFLVKRGIAEKARKAGFTNITELDAWETATVGSITITAAPGKHGVPEITYLLAADGLTVYFGGDTLLIPELRDIPRRFPQIDLALLAVNGLQIRPLLNRPVVMNAQEAGEFCGLLHPRFAVPMHYTFTGGALSDHLLLKYNGTAEEFAQAAARHAPETTVRILLPGQPLVIEQAGVPVS